MLLSYTIVDFHLFYDGAVDMQIWAPPTRSQCKVCDTQVTVKACGPLVLKIDKKEIFLEHITPTGCAFEDVLKVTKDEFQQRLMSYLKINPVFRINSIFKQLFHPNHELLVHFPPIECHWVLCTCVTSYVDLKKQLYLSLDTGHDYNLSWNGCIFRSPESLRWPIAMGWRPSCDMRRASFVGR